MTHFVCLTGLYGPLRCTDVSASVPDDEELLCMLILTHAENPDCQDRTDLGVLEPDNQCSKLCIIVQQRYVRFGIL